MSTPLLPVILTPVVGKTKQAFNTTLFHIAAKLFGDAMQWARIARINPVVINADGFVDPWVGAQVSINVPPSDTSANSYSGVMSSFPLTGSAYINGDFSNDFSYQFVTFGRKF